jgi:hypothetical protein
MLVWMWREKVVRHNSSSRDSVSAGSGPACQAFISASACRGLRAPELTPGQHATVTEVHAYIREERDTWDRSRP